LTSFHPDTVKTILKTVKPILHSKRCIYCLNHEHLLPSDPVIL